MSSKIAWCDETINPVVGCSKISAGCQNCYAEGMARRLANMGLGQYKHVTRGDCRPVGRTTPFNSWNGLTAFVPSVLDKPLKWKKPRSIFISSMGDLFHESVPLGWIDDVIQMIWRNPAHTFIFLTKRPERMLKYFTGEPLPLSRPLKNLVMGVSVEDQQTADERIPVLLQIPSVKRFISVEPLLGPVDISPWGSLLSGVILGGESGPKARPIHPEWVRNIRDQCRAEGVPFMFKQWGEWGPSCNHGSANAECIGKAAITLPPYVMYRIGKKAAGNVLDGETHLALPW